MVETFLAILAFVFFCFVVAMFLSWCFAKQRVRYGDWSREEKRQRLLEIVQAVREERGDYVSVPRTKLQRSIPKSAAPKKGNRVGSAPRRAVQRKG